MKKQITVTERNDWEGETFKYVISVTPEEESQIVKKCQKYGQGSLFVDETNYSDDEIARLNAMSGNCYMDFIAPYKIIDGALKNWRSFGDCFYKGVGLTKLKKTR